MQAPARPWVAALLFLPHHPSAHPLLASRALRAFGDGYMALLLPAYLLELGLGTLDVGLISTATMLGSALATLAVGAWGHRFASHRLLRAAACLMAATGLAFVGAQSFWPLLVVAFVGTLNPSSGDVSVFLPLEHARLADSAQGEARVALPGGDDFGPRPIDIHLRCLGELGAEFETRHGYVHAHAGRLVGRRVMLEFPSVTATENVLMAAVRAKGMTVIENAAREPEVADLAAFCNRMGAHILGAGTSTITIEGVDELVPV